jgi:hypothetical protein
LFSLPHAKPFGKRFELHNIPFLTPQPSPFPKLDNEHGVALSFLDWHARVLAGPLYALAFHCAVVPTMAFVRGFSP